MPLENKSKLKNQVVLASRENGISYAVFRNTIGKRLGLSSTDFDGLDLIFFRGITTPSELSKYTGLTSGSTTIMIDRLERAGLAKRQDNPNDRRGVQVVITEAAACTVGPLFASARVAQSELLAQYSPQELEILTDYFTKSATMFETERLKASL